VPGTNTCARTPATDTRERPVGTDPIRRPIRKSVIWEQGEGISSLKQTEGPLIGQQHRPGDVTARVALSLYRWQEGASGIRDRLRVLEADQLATRTWRQVTAWVT
jgi:hypothetical protein